MHPINGVRRIALVGTQGVGASWAVFYLAKGFDVAATDPHPHAEATLRRFIDSAWATVTALGLSPKASPEHLDFTSDLAEAVSDAEFIQESGSDQESEKIALFSTIADAAPRATIIASSSSVVSMSVLQAACEHPERCVIGHPLDPPHLIPLVEVVGGQQTSDETIRETMAFYESVGKKPIHLGKEVGDRSLNEIARERDHALLDLLRERNRRRAAPTSHTAEINQQPLEKDRSHRDGQDS